MKIKEVMNLDFRIHFLPVEVVFFTIYFRAVTETNQYFSPYFYSFIASFLSLSIEKNSIKLNIIEDVLKHNARNLDQNGPQTKNLTLSLFRQDTVKGEDDDMAPITLTGRCTPARAPCRWWETASGSGRLQSRADVQSYRSAAQQTKRHSQLRLVRCNILMWTHFPVHARGIHKCNICVCTPRGLCSTSFQRVLHNPGGLQGRLFPFARAGFLESPAN